MKLKCIKTALIVASLLLTANFAFAVDTVSDAAKTAGEKAKEAAADTKASKKAAKDAAKAKAKAAAADAKAGAAAAKDNAKTNAKAAVADTKASATATKDAAKGAAKAPAAAATKAAATDNLVDINTATEAELKAIPGIGDTYAAKIIAGRPYTMKTQLKSRNILPAPAYEKVKGQIIAKKAVKPAAAKKK
jgi:DNA uptake protein ComE-like DNA-binding protein